MHMYQEAMKQLELWKSGSDREPLILRGARQVGKTWLMKESGKLYYEKYALFVVFRIGKWYIYLKQWKILFSSAMNYI